MAEVPTPIDCLNARRLAAVVTQMMEWTEFHMRETIIRLLKVSHSAVKIHTPLRPLKVNERHVYHVKKLFKETGDVHDGPPVG